MSEEDLEEVVSESLKLLMDKITLARRFIPKTPVTATKTTVTTSEPQSVEINHDPPLQSESSSTLESSTSTVKV